MLLQQLRADGPVRPLPFSPFSDGGHLLVGRRGVELIVSGMVRKARELLRLVEKGRSR